jgi:hypothetical protein
MIDTARRCARVFEAGQGVTCTVATQSENKNQHPNPASGGWLSSITPGPTTTHCSVAAGDGREEWGERREAGDGQGNSRITIRKKEFVNDLKKFTKALEASRKLLTVVGVKSPINGRWVRAEIELKLKSVGIDAIKRMTICNWQEINVEPEAGETSIMY